MPTKPKSRNWNDVQTAIATAAIVATLGLWNLLATPSKVVKAVETREPALPSPPTELSAEDQVAPGGPIIPTAMPQVKIIFTPGATPIVQQQVQPVQQPAKKKKKKNNNNNSGSVSVTQTKTS